MYYTTGSQLGEKGKDGITFLATDRNGTKYAVKTFRKNKSSKSIERESDLQNKASCVAPTVTHVNTQSKCIVMQKMTRHVFPTRNLSIVDQKQIVRIHKKLDECGVFHGDSNPANYMYLGRKIYMIDFGLAKLISETLVRRLGTLSPNVDIMLPGIVNRLKELGYSSESYNEICSHIPKKQRVLFGL
jgi:serine/threonine protein kinase